jgi:hypothetical protein
MIRMSRINESGGLLTEHLLLKVTMKKEDCEQ